MGKVYQILTSIISLCAVLAVGMMFIPGINAQVVDYAVENSNKVAEQNQTIDDLTTQLEELNQQKSQLQADYDAGLIENESLTMEMANLNSQIETLNNQIEVLNNQLNMYQQQGEVLDHYSINITAYYEDENGNKDYSQIDNLSLNTYFNETINFSNSFEFLPENNYSLNASFADLPIQDTYINIDTYKYQTNTYCDYAIGKVLLNGQELELWGEGNISHTQIHLDTNQVMYNNNIEVVLVDLKPQISFNFVDINGNNIYGDIDLELFYDMPSGGGGTSLNGGMMQTYVLDGYYADVTKFTLCYPSTSACCSSHNTAFDNDYGFVPNAYGKQKIVGVTLNGIPLASPYEIYTAGLVGKNEVVVTIENAEPITIGFDARYVNCDVAIDITSGIWYYYDFEYTDIAINNVSGEYVTFTAPDLSKCRLTLTTDSAYSNYTFTATDIYGNVWTANIPANSTGYLDFIVSRDIQISVEYS